MKSHEEPERQADDHRRVKRDHREDDAADEAEQRPPRR
jgi:hypothetical protein